VGAFVVFGYSIAGRVDHFWEATMRAWVLGVVLAVAAAGVAGPVAADEGEVLWAQ
jgi:hypothetical protein